MKIKQTAPENTSAIGNAHQQAPSPPTFARIKAAGSSTISCLSTDTARLRNPCPSAWNTEDATTENPAIKKLRLMIRRAGIPIASMSSDALKIPRSAPGKSWNTANPASIMHTP